MLKFIPKNILKDVLDLYKYTCNNIKQYNKKTYSQKILEKYNIILMLKILKKFQSSHYFNNNYSINRKEWSNIFDYLCWSMFNQKHIYNSYTGLLSNINDPNIIKPIIGDIILRNGVANIFLFEHWGIYIGNYKNIGYIAEIHSEDYSENAIVTLTPLHKFVKSYPLQIKNTISFINNKYIDFRLVNRQISLWTILLCLKLKWIYSLSISLDQTCQSFINLLIRKQLYTTQLYNILLYFIYIYHKQKL